MAVKELEQAAPAPPPAPRMRRIQPSSGLVPIDFGELWRYRHLLFRLLWRDIKARYRQTYLGPFWAIFRPFVHMVVMAAIFGGLAGFQSGTDVPYPLFLYGGILIWTYFASALTGTASALISNAGLLGKAYFPRLYAPLSAVTAPLVDFVIAIGILFALFAYYGRLPSWQIVFLPLFILLALLAGLGVGLWLCGASVRYRDVPFALPFVIQIGFFATPVLYPVSRLPEPYASIVALNPMTSVVEGFRWALFDITPPDLGVLFTSAAVTVALVVAGLYFFRRTERTIVDLI